MTNTKARTIDAAALAARYRDRTASIGRGRIVRACPCHGMGDACSAVRDMILPDVVQDYRNR